MGRTSLEARYKKEHMILTRQPITEYLKITIKVLSKRIILMQHISVEKLKEHGNGKSDVHRLPSASTNFQHCLPVDSVILYYTCNSLSI